MGGGDEGGCRPAQKGGRQNLHHRWVGVGQSAQRTSVVFDAHMYSRVDQIGGYVHRLLAVYKYILMFRGVVCCACCYVQYVLLVGRHAGSETVLKVR
jgi:hypothetical protein